MISSFPLRITVIGGCHVVGYPLGVESSFVTVLQNELQNKSIEVDIFRCGYSNLKKIQQGIKICEDTRPDILILQVGNYLFNPILFKGVRKKLKHPRNSNGSNEKMPTCIPGIDINSVFIPGKSFLLKQLFKRMLHELIFYKALNQRSCARYVDTYFAAIKMAGIKSALVLGAFPTQDYVMNKYRQIGNRILYRKCLEHGFKYLDVFHFIKQNFDGRIFSVDFMHLSSEAHYALGKFVADYISLNCATLHKNEIPLLHRDTLYSSS